MYGFGGYYGYYPGFYFDPTYILILIGAIISMWASARVKSTYAKYDREHNLRGITGAQVAQMILHQAGIYDVAVQRVSGNLTDHYDPAHRVLRLSDSVFGRATVAAVGVAVMVFSPIVRTLPVVPEIVISDPISTLRLVESDRVP